MTLVTGAVPVSSSKNHFENITDNIFASNDIPPIGNEDIASIRQTDYQTESERYGKVLRAIEDDQGYQRKTANALEISQWNVKRSETGANPSVGKHGVEKLLATINRAEAFARVRKANSSPRVSSALRRTRARRRDSSTNEWYFGHKPGSFVFTYKELASPLNNYVQFLTCGPLCSSGRTMNDWETDKRLERTLLGGIIFVGTVPRSHREYRDRAREILPLVLQKIAWEFSLNLHEELPESAATQMLTRRAADQQLDLTDAAKVESLAINLLIEGGEIDTFGMLIARSKLRSVSILCEYVWLAHQLQCGEGRRVPRGMNEVCKAIAFGCEMSAQELIDMHNKNLMREAHWTLCDMTKYDKIAIFKNQTGEVTSRTFFTVSSPAPMATAASKHPLSAAHYTLNYPYTHHWKEDAYLSLLFSPHVVLHLITLHHALTPGLGTTFLRPSQIASNSIQTKLANTNSLAGHHLLL